MRDGAGDASSSGSSNGRSNGDLHEYVRVGRFYANSGLGPVQFSRHLCRQSEQFLGSEGKSRSKRGRFAGSLPAPVATWAQVMRQLLLFLRKRGGGAGKETLLIPVDGDFALLRRSGAIKVLDASENRVYTVIRDPGDRQKLAERVELARSVSELPFAPLVLDVDLDRGYFCEEFLGGAHPIDFAGCGDDFSEVYRPLLVSFLRAKEPKWQDTSGYVEGLCEEILDSDGLLGRLAAEDREEVSSFVREMGETLSGVAGRIPLVLSHGDYFSGNIVIRDGKQWAIDWANMGFRSPMHDLYYLYLNHCCRVLDDAALDRRSRLALEQLREELRVKDSERFEQLDEYLVPEDGLRRIFYLECIHVPLMRCSRPDDRYVSSMLERVSWFRRFEASQRAAVGRTEAVASTSGATPR